MTAPLGLDTFGTPVSVSGKTPVPQLGAQPLTPAAPTTPSFMTAIPGQTDAQRAAAIAAAGQTPAKTVPPPSEPAVLSSGTITDTVIPDNNKRLDDVSKKGTYQGTDGSLYYSDGSLVPAPLDAEYDAGTKKWNSGGSNYGAAPEYIDNADNDPQVANTNRILASLKSSLDASTSAQINGIQKQYDLLRAQQTDANGRNEAGRTRVQLLGGAARYAPLAADGVILAQTTYGLQQIQKLDADEDIAIANVREAQRTGNYQIMEKGLSTVESIRQEKIKTAQSVADALSKVNAATAERNKLVDRDEAVAGLVAGGITDPQKLFTAARAAGLDVTVDDIKKVLTALVPKATDSDLYKFSNNDIGPLLAAGIDAGTIQGVQDYLNGHGDAAAYSNLTAAQQAAFQTALAGKTASSSASGSNDTGKPFTFTNEQTSQLLSGDFTQSEIRQMQSDLAAHGLDAVLKGLPDDQQKLVKRVLSKSDSVNNIGDDAPDESQQFITQDYLQNLFGEDGLKTAANDAGYRHYLMGWDEEKQNYLDSLLNTVAQYREAGYTDKEILKMMQS